MRFHGTASRFTLFYPDALPHFVFLFVVYLLAHFCSFPEIPLSARAPSFRHLLLVLLFQLFSTCHLSLSYTNHRASSENYFHCRVLLMFVVSTLVPLLTAILSLFQFSRSASNYHKVEDNICRIFGLAKKRTILYKKLKKYVIFVKMFVLSASTFTACGFN